LQNILLCAKLGLADEIVALGDLRKYFVAFTGAAYQNPKSICSQHNMILPRIIKGYQYNTQNQKSLDLTTILFSYRWFGCACDLYMIF